MQSAHQHLRGRGCPICGRLKNIEKQLTPTNVFVEQATSIHASKYSYDNTSLRGMKRDIEIICPKHGTFWQRPDNHLLGVGCPTCTHTISKPEVAWLDLLEVSEDKRHKTITVNGAKYKVDALDGNTIYEFYGDFWHGNPTKFQPTDVNLINKKSFGELYEKTVAREQILIESGYNVVSMWESDFMSP